MEIGKYVRNYEIERVVKGKIALKKFFSILQQAWRAQWRGPHVNVNLATVYADISAGVTSEGKFYEFKDMNMFHQYEGQYNDDWIVFVNLHRTRLPLDRHMFQ